MTAPGGATEDLSQAIVQQAIEFVFDDLIALAAGCFQALTVEDRDLASVAADQPGCLQVSRSPGDTLATSPSILAMNSWVIRNSADSTRS